MFGHPRLPIKVRLNHSLAPARLLSIYTSKREPLAGFTADWGVFGAPGAGGMGSDLFESPPLESWNYLDVVAYDPSRFQHRLESSRHLLALAVPPGELLCLNFIWSADDDSVTSARASVIWTFEELVAGRAPRLAIGDEVLAVQQLMRTEGSRVTADLLALRRRVREMSHADIRERQRRESVRYSMQQDAARSTLVRSIAVSGYRSFRETSTLTLALPKEGVEGSGLTVVVGANSAGKSSLWECFDAIARSGAQQGTGRVSFSQEHRNQGTPSGVQIDLTRTDESTYTLRSIEPDTSETTASWSPDDPALRDDLKIVVIPSRRYFRASFGKNENPRPDWMNNGGMGFTRYQERDPFTSRLFTLHNDKLKKAKFDDLLAKVVGQRLDWKIDLANGQNGQSYFLKVTPSKGVSHTSDGLGDGIISLLFILDALYDPEPRSLLVIDEPELSLHPQLIRRLGREISRVAAERQVVIFTHSPLLISWDDIESGAEIARVHKTGGDSHVAQPDRAVIDEVSKARRGWKNPHVLGSDANEAWFLDDKIIVVEGQEDAALLPVVFDEAGVARRGTIFGWGSGGGDGNPRRIVGLLASLGFTKVVALLDADKSGEVEAIRSQFPDYLATTIPSNDIRDKPGEGKAGLLDEKGRSIKPELKAATQAVLTVVVEYFDSSDRSRL